MKNAIKAAMIALTMTAASAGAQTAAADPALSYRKTETLTGAIIGSGNPDIFIVHGHNCVAAAGRPAPDIRVESDFGLTCRYGEKPGAPPALMPQSYRIVLSFKEELEERGIKVVSAPGAASALIWTEDGSRITGAEIGKAVEAAYHRLVTKNKRLPIQLPF